MPRGHRRGQRGHREATVGVVPDAGADDRSERVVIFSKTKMCKFHILGMCAKGSGCKFAHHKDELMALPDLSRTKLCKTLITTGSCEDPECKYAHNRQELRGMPEPDADQIAAVSRGPAGAPAARGAIAPSQQAAQMVIDPQQQLLQMNSMLAFLAAQQVPQPQGATDQMEQQAVAFHQQLQAQHQALTQAIQSQQAMLWAQQQQQQAQQSPKGSPPQQQQQQPPPLQQPAQLPPFGQSRGVLQYSGRGRDAGPKPQPVQRQAPVEVGAPQDAASSGDPRLVVKNTFYDFEGHGAAAAPQCPRPSTWAHGLNLIGRCASQESMPGDPVSPASKKDTDLSAPTFLAAPAGVPTATAAAQTEVLDKRQRSNSGSSGSSLGLSAIPERKITFGLRQVSEGSETASTDEPNTDTEKRHQDTPLGARGATEDDEDGSRSNLSTLDEEEDDGDSPQAARAPPPHSSQAFPDPATLGSTGSLVVKNTFIEFSEAGRPVGQGLRMVQTASGRLDAMA